MRGMCVSQGNIVILVGTPSFVYFAFGATGALVNANGLSFIGNDNSYHPGQVSNDGTAMMYPTSNGNWP
jgi:hypothetical protein